MDSRKEVNIEPQPIKSGEKVRIKYQGSLTEMDVQQVYLYAGLGEKTDWETIQEVEMNLNPDGTWTAELEVPSTQSLSFCFHDENDSWDNNQGRNWRYFLQH